MHYLKGIPVLFFALGLVVAQYYKGEITPYQLGLFVLLLVLGIIAGVIWSKSK